MRCIDHPVSWMTLERYHLNELPLPEAEKVAAHLAACPACGAIFTSIEADDRAMPLLPVVEKPVHRPLPWAKLVPAVAAAAAIAVLALFVIPSVLEKHKAMPPGRIAYKGGELALTVARERKGAVVENPDRYLSGDRFLLFATVPGKEPMPWDVAVFQAGEVFFPYDTREALMPGNRILLPGAFRVTGKAPAEICLFTGRSLPNRDDIERLGKEALPDATVCRALESGDGE